MNDLWTCPECGHQFVTRNMWHSCGNFDIDVHFAGTTPLVCAIFEELEQAVRGFGPVTVYAQKTRIVFQARTRFASAVTRKRWLNVQIWLKRRTEHRLLQRVEMYTYRDFGHLFRLSTPEDLDEDLVALLREAYVHGCR